MDMKQSTCLDRSHGKESCACIQAKAITKIWQRPKVKPKSVWRETCQPRTEHLRFEQGSDDPVGCHAATDTLLQDFVLQHPANGSASSTYLDNPHQSLDVGGFGKQKICDQQRKLQRRAANTERQRRFRASMPPDKLQALRAANAAYQRKARAAMSPARRQAQRDANAARQRRLRAAQSLEELQASRAANAAYQRKARASKSPKQ